MIIISKSGGKKVILYKAKWHSRILKRNTRVRGWGEEAGSLVLEKRYLMHEKIQCLLSKIVHFPHVSVFNSFM